VAERGTLLRCWLRKRSRSSNLLVSAWWPVIV